MVYVVCVWCTFVLCVCGVFGYVVCVLNVGWCLCAFVSVCGECVEFVYLYVCLRCVCGLFVCVMCGVCVWCVFVVCVCVTECDQV